MLAFQVLSGRGLRGVFPSVPQSTPPLLASSAQEEGQPGRRPSGKAEGKEALAGLGFQLALCVPKQAAGVIAGPQLVPELRLSKRWPKAQIGP